MRSEYSVTMELAETEQRKHFKDVLTRMNIQWEPRWEGNIFTYRVSLSKYELVYLRLACKTGKIKSVECVTSEVE